MLYLSFVYSSLTKRCSLTQILTIDSDAANHRAMRTNGPDRIVGTT